MKQQSNKKRPENASKCICESLELQNSPGEHAPGPSWGRTFGKYIRLLLLSTHLCENLLKPLVMRHLKSTLI